MITTQSQTPSLLGQSSSSWFASSPANPPFMIEYGSNASCSSNLRPIEKWGPNCDKWLLSPANPSESLVAQGTIKCVGGGGVQLRASMWFILLLLLTCCCAITLLTSWCIRPIRSNGPCRLVQFPPSHQCISHWIAAHTLPHPTTTSDEGITSPGIEIEEKHN